MSQFLAQCGVMGSLNRSAHNGLKTILVLNRNFLDHISSSTLHGGHLTRKHLKYGFHNKSFIQNAHFQSSTLGGFAAAPTQSRCQELGNWPEVHSE